MTFHERYLVGCAALAVAALVTARLADARPGRGGAECRGGPERLADLSRHLQVLALQRPRPDQRRQRQESRSRLDAFAGARHPRPAVDAAGRSTACCTIRAPTAGSSRWTARPARRSGPTRRSSTRTWSPSRRTRRTTAASRIGHGNVYVGTVDGAPDRARHEDRQAGLGHQAARFREADGRLHRRAAGRQGQGHHRRPGRRVARSRTDLRRRRARPARRNGSSSRSPAPKRPWRPGAATPGGPAAAAAGCPAAYDPETNTVWWGTANPAPLYDWSGADWKTERTAAGRQSLHHIGHRARSRYRQAQVLPSGAAARRLGLRQLPSASSS